MSRWDKDDYLGDHWSIWLNGLDKVLAEIEQIDKESDYRRLKFILNHDENRGYDNIEDLI